MQSSNILLADTNTSNGNRKSYGSSESQPEQAESNEKPKTTPTKLNHFIGIILAAMLGLVYTLGSFIIKYLRNKTAIDLVFMIFLGSSIFSLPMVIKCRKTGIDRKFIALIFISAILTLVMSISRSTALKFLPIGETSAIVFNAPIFTAIFARTILKDSISRITVFSLLVSLIGMMLIAKVPDMIKNALDNDSSRNVNSIGYVYALTAVVLLSLCNILSRMLRYVNHWVVCFCQSTVAALIIAAVSPAIPDLTLRGECSYQSWLFLGIGVYGFIMSVLIFTSFKYEDPVVVSSIMLTTDIISSFLTQVFFFNDPIDVYGYSGISLLFCSFMLLPFRKWVLSLPRESRIRQKLQWMEK